VVIGGAQLLKLLLAGSRGYGAFVFRDIHIVVLGVDKAFFRNIALPAYRVAVLFDRK
jgi:3-hydroxymyristoyl/3-hydroxydecanoyl-(acyl carrier protein) dehydratase